MGGAAVAVAAGCGRGGVGWGGPSEAVSKRRPSGQAARGCCGRLPKARQRCYAALAGQQRWPALTLAPAARSHPSRAGCWGWVPRVPPLLAVRDR